MFIEYPVHTCFIIQSDISGERPITFETEGKAQRFTVKKAAYTAYTANLTVRV